MSDSNSIRHRGIQIDLGRVIERPETVKRLIDWYASLNYNVLQLYFENALVFPSHPKLGRAFAWTIEQAMEVVEHASRLGIKTIPAIQSLGHCYWVGSHPEYRELDETFESGSVSGVLCPSHPRTLEMLDAMVRDVAPLATSGIIHLGMDESFTIGRCSRCTPRRETIGEGGIFREHANRVAAMAREVKCRPAIWGDMFYYHPDQVARLDKDILIFDWFYYAFERCPRIELFNFEEIDTLALWKQNGLDAWGCPWTNCTVVMPYNQPSQSIENARSWMRYLRERRCDGIMVTQWELAPSEVDFCPPMEAAIAVMLNESPGADARELLALGCEKLYDRPKLGELIEELSLYRFHGHCARRWLHADSIGGMLTYGNEERDELAVDAIERLGKEIADEIHGAKHESHLRCFVNAAKWLAYQYRKRALLNSAARDVAEKKWSDALSKVFRVSEDCLSVAFAWDIMWKEDRNHGDASPTLMRLMLEQDLLNRELDAIKSAQSGKPYAGELNRPVLFIHVTNSHPGAVSFAVATSTDGATFSENRVAWMIQFDNRAARPRSDDMLSYAFPLDRLDDARFVKITSLGCGRFTLRGATACQAANSLRAVVAPARELGPPNAREAYNRMLADGDASRAFSLVNDHLILRLD